MQLNPPIHIRAARVEDDPRVGDLLVHAFVETYRRKMPEVVVTDGRKKDLRDLPSKRLHGTVLVAEVQSDLVGTITLLRADVPNSRLWNPQLAEVRSLAVADAWRGSAVGRELVKSAEAEAANWGCAGTGLHVRRGAEGVARFYQNQGYVRTPQGDLVLPEVTLDAYFKQF